MLLRSHEGHSFDPFLLGSRGWEWLLLNLFFPRMKQRPDPSITELQNENKTLSDTLKHSDAAWDEKLSTVLAKLDGYQDAKDNPGRVSLDTNLDDL
jgi:hypothetical protein